MMIDMRPKTVVVTGGYGFIGSRFIKHVYENSNWKIVNVDKGTYAADPARVPENIRKDEERYQYIKTDICDPTLCEKYPNIQDAHYVVNFAAESHVDNSIEDGKPFVDTNIGGVYNLLECFKNSQHLKRFVQISTDEVYGDMTEYRGKPHATESFPIKPSSYYSASKASADLLVQAASRTFGTPYLITRTCNNFGPGQDPEKFLPKIAECIQQETIVPVYGDGKQIREWMHVDDNVAVIFRLMKDSKTRNSVYNIGTGYEYTNNQIIRMIGEILQTEVHIEYVEDRKGHDRRYSLDCSKLGELVEFAHPWFPQTLQDFFRKEFI